MPYTKKNLPDWVKRMPSHAQDIWMGAFNSSFKKYGEKRAFKIAISAVKKAGFRKKGDKWSKMAGETTAGSLDPSGATISKKFASKKKKKKESKLKISGGKKKMKKMSKFVKWSYKTKQGLPDSAFAAISGEGDKKIRKLPYKDASGKVDVPHLRNALVRVAQGKTDLDPSMRAKAMEKLKSVAKSYLKTNKETKSGAIMSKFISKFENNAADKVGAIIKTLKDKATNKKPSEEVVFDVKGISLLIQDLEEIEKLEKAKSEGEEEETEEDDSEEEKEKKKKGTEEETEEEKSKKKKKKKETDEEESEEGESDTEEDTDEKKKKSKGEEEEESEEDDSEEGEEKKDKKKKETDEEEEEESKFKELLKVCDGYKEQVDRLTTQISKFEKLKKEQEKKVKELNQEISKFKEVSHTKLAKSTAEKVSKFKHLAPHQKVELEQRYSKMSDSALEELGRITEDQMFSKLEEPKETTKPSELLEPAEQEQDFSKMSKEEQLDELAKIQAKARGFVE